MVLKNSIALIALVLMLFSTVGCMKTSLDKDDKYEAAMITDAGGVNDQSFNTSAWEGLQRLNQLTGAKVSYIESNQASDYNINMDKLADRDCNLIWGVGFAMADAVLISARMNPDLHYAIIDNSYGDETPKNVIGVVFKAQESAFLVGYAAGKTTKTNSVGFVGGIKGNIVDQFEYGYIAGVKYAANEMKKDINVSVQYIESFSDATKGKATASKMFSSGCDVVFHASGGAGLGVIEAAKEAGQFAIGADRDQSYLAPQNVLTSALKNVSNAVVLVSMDDMNGINHCGTTMLYGLKDNCVGIPEENPNMSKDVYNDTMEIKEKIINDQILPPQNETEYKEFLKTLT